MKNYIFYVAQIILTIILLALAVDFIGFCLWFVSGQVPADSFFVGTITTHTLRALFF